MRLVWLNGALVEEARARIDPADRGFTLGDGVFETIRAIAGEVAFADQHLARLHDGASMLGIVVPFDDDVLTDALRMVAGGTDCALRLTLTRGPAARGLAPAGAAHPTVLITAGALPPALLPARVVIARTTRRNEHSPLSRIKSLNCLDNIIARLEADAAGYDDALLLNTKGTLAEASAANVFLNVGGVWVTPPVSDGALPGLARARLLAAREAVEATVSVSDLETASAAFLINSLGRRSVSIPQ